MRQIYTVVAFVVSLIHELLKDLFGMGIRKLKLVDQKSGRVLTSAQAHQIVSHLERSEVADLSYMDWRRKNESRKLGAAR